MVATSIPLDPLLDMTAGQGQFTCSYRFHLYDFPTGTVVGEVFPVRTPPVISHDVSRTIVRQLENFYLLPDDAALVDTIRHRVQVEMIVPGRAAYPLGTFMYMDNAVLVRTDGRPMDSTLVDSMFIVDQEIERTYAAGTFEPDGTISAFRQVDDAISDVLRGLPVNYTAEPTPFYTIGVWEAGNNRGSVIGDLAVDGDYFNPWFDNTDTMRFIRSFDPATKIPKFDYDAGFAVNRDSIVLTNDLIAAPNRFIVISNGSVTDGVLPVVGSYDVPASAPHSIANRGFVIPKVIDWQVDYTSQANAIAANLGQRQTIYERIEFTTGPDPRHDAYDVFHFGGSNWLELAWSLPLAANGVMSHVGRKAYS